MTTKPKTAYCYDPLFLNHDTGAHHPEHSGRLAAAHAMLAHQPWFAELQALDVPRADLHWVSQVHDPSYIDRVQQTCAAGGHQMDSPDVAVSRASFDIALHAAGSVLAIADQVLSGSVENGFALVRPPGHHAEQAAAMGFCLFNNVAIAARYLQQQHDLERILILDWDVHHGNGTQHTFEQDDSVFYMSLHQFPHYPGTGARSECGFGAGVGTTLNCPMAAGAEDADYHQAFMEKILPAAQHFHADAILLSAGFDAHRADPLGAINLTTTSYEWMTRAMTDLAARDCGGRIISILEGGYDLTALAESICGHVRVLCGR